MYPIRQGRLYANECTPLKAICRVLTYPLRRKRSPALLQDVVNAAALYATESLTIADLRLLVAPTSEACVQSYCKSRGLEPKTLELDTKDGRAVAHWIGDPDAGTIMLFYHGGAYTMPANETQFRLLDRPVRDLNSDQHKPSVSFLLLAYTLAPEAVYPSQLREAAVVLAHLVQKTRRSPSKILVAGDSAGGNLALSLLSHIRHPHPGVFPIKLQCPLGGALLISPWVSFRTDSPSYKSNVHLDVLSPLALRRWSAMFLGQADTLNPEADPGPVSGDA